MDRHQTHFKFLGWPFHFAVVQAESKARAVYELKEIVAAYWPRHDFETRINTVTECDSPVTTLPLTIEDNTCIDNKGEGNINKKHLRPFIGGLVDKL